MRAIFLLFIVVNCLVCSSEAQADGRIDGRKILWGQTAAIEGPASALGEGMRAGILAAFKEINDQGGIHGQTMELITYDDGYEPDQAIDNTKKLIDEDHVFALIGGVGTPTANAIVPITSQAAVPFVGAFTGAELLRNPFQRYVVNLRASYWQETEAWIEHLTKDLNVERIAIFFQDDKYGRAGLTGVERALAKRNLKLVGKGSYKRNTTAVKSALLSIRKSNPEAIVMVGAYKPSAEFIKLATQLGLDVYFVNISFVGSYALAHELGSLGEGVIVSQVVPLPTEASVPIVKSYQNALSAYDPEIEYGFVSLEGYIVGRFVIEVLKNMSGDMRREAFIDKIYEMQTINLDGLELTFGPNDNQGLDDVFFTVLKKDGRFMSVTDLKVIGEKDE